MKHEAITTAFPIAKPTLEKYAQWLATEGLTRGLLGPREVDRIWDRHIANCAVIEALIPRNATVADIGSGAGLPGLVLAIVRPDITCTLIEPLLRRSEFLAEVITDLELPNVEVLRAKADQISNLKVDIVTARAVAPLNRLLTWALPLMKPAGAILAMKGSAAADEISQAAHELAGYTAEIVKVGTGFVDPPTTVVQVKKAQ